MDCPVCKERMRRIGLERVLMGKIVQEFECPSCHTRQSKAIEK
ncbi:MAG: hypothetical protein V1777_03255 [Candidatus Micrarchaeota archaeon]